MSINENVVTPGETEAAKVVGLSRRGLLKGTAVAGLAIASVGVAGASAVSAATSTSAGTSPRSPLEPANQGNDPLLAAGAEGMAVLQGFYDKSRGLWNTNGWWNAACCLYATIDYCRFTGTAIYRGDIPQTFAVAPLNNPDHLGSPHYPAGFVDSAYDDCGWWGITWVNAYDLTGDEAYLHTARSLFARMTQGWDNDDVHGGGVFWETDHPGVTGDPDHFRETIANELFLLLAALLHQRTPGDSSDPGSYLDWAKKEWAWFQGSGLITPSGLINDGIAPDGQNDRLSHTTYNQGVILGGLVAMHEITGDSSYLTAAESIADAALKYMTVQATVDGRTVQVLNETSATADMNGAQFKGIFMRYLRELYQQLPNPSYMQFILNNAASIRLNAASGGQFGFLWQGQGPEDIKSAQYASSVQSSAMEAINAAIAVTYDPPPGQQSPGNPYPVGTNLVSNPSGAGGTEGWYSAFDDPGVSLNSAKHQGTQVLVWTVPEGTVREEWVRTYPDVTNGKTYTYAVQLAGSGTVILDAWVGNADLISMPVELTDSFQTVWIQAAIPADAPTGQSGSAPQLQIATAGPAGPADVLVFIKSASVVAIPA